MTSGLARRFLGWFGIVPSRVLQLDEICPVVGERLRSDALEGLATSYLPSSVTIGVSPGDHALLIRFEGDLRRMLRDRLAALVSEKEWTPSAEGFQVHLEPRAELNTGDSPVLETAFGGGVERVAFSPAGKGTGRAEARVAGADALEVVVTAVDGDATALQERFLVVLGATLPPALAGLAESQGEVRMVKVRNTDTAEARLIPAVGSRPSLVWSPRGVVVVGREKDAAHLIPTVPAAVVSAAHFALQCDARGVLAISDLGSSNGTWLAGERVGTGWRSVSLPFSVTIGSGGRVRIDVRQAAFEKARP